MKKSIKLSRNKSLKWQLLSRFFLILATLLIIIGISQYLIMKQYLYKSKEQLLESRFHNIEISTLAKIQTPDDVIKNAQLLIRNTIDVNISVAIIDKNGNIAASANKPEDTARHYFVGKQGDSMEIEYDTPVPELQKDDYLKLLSQRGELKVYRLLKDKNNNLQIVMWHKIGNIDSPSGLIQFSLSAKSIQDILLKLLYIYIAASIIVLIMGSILGVTVLEKTLKPLYSMTDAVEKINVGQLNTRLPIDNVPLEINRLSIAFNNMLERIETSFEKEQYIKEKMRQFVSDASHELRTPLTSIHGFVEVLLRGAAKNEGQLDLALNSILIESERLTKLVNDLLLLTKLDQQVPVEMRIDNIGDIIKDIYPQLQILAGDRTINLQLMNNIFAYINRNQIKQVVFNLVQNAVHHTDERNGIITISTNYLNRPTGNFAELSVKDNGTGIQKDQLNEIFDRFFRGETHRSRKHGGYGLGLSIVKSIVESHDGKIEVNSDLGIGTTFLIYFKKPTI